MEAETCLDHRWTSTYSLTVWSKINQKSNWEHQRGKRYCSKCQTTQVVSRSREEAKLLKTSEWEYCDSEEEEQLAHLKPLYQQMAITNYYPSTTTNQTSWYNSSKINHNYLGGGYKSNPNSDDDATSEYYQNPYTDDEEENCAMRNLFDSPQHEEEEGEGEEFTTINLSEKSSPEKEKKSVNSWENLYNTNSQDEDKDFDPWRTPPRGRSLSTFRSSRSNLRNSIDFDDFDVFDNSIMGPKGANIWDA